jgi:HPt (histidine-containing phosphotransfer) domain-containing protein
MAWNPDLVLMDLFMPVMGGLEATRAIRQWEAKSESRSRPILALTAHVTGEGKKASLEAGCNEHFTKPIKKTTLLNAIFRHLSLATDIRGRATSNGEGNDYDLPEITQIDIAEVVLPASSSIPCGVQAQPSEAQRALNLEQLVVQTDGDASLIRTMALMFLADAPKKMEGIRAALESGNPSSLLKLSHALKGSAAQFFAEPAVTAALRLETIAQTEDLAQAQPAYEELATQIALLKRELTHLVESQPISD